MRLCETVLRPQCEAGPIRHIEHIERIGHSDVDADKATKLSSCIDTIKCPDPARS